MLPRQRIIQIPHPPVTRPTRQALELAVLYMLLCSTYILVSGYVATHVSATPQQLHLAGRIKDITFIVITGGLFGVISYLRYRRIRRQEEIIIVQEKTLIQDERQRVAAMTAAAVAHDLNNLLMILSGLVEGIEDREREDSFMVEMRKHIQVGIDKLRHLAQRLASVVSRVVPDKEEHIDMKAALQELIALVQKHPDARLCRIVLADIAPLTLALNRTLFEEAGVNLLVNAVQASGPRGQIEVRLTTEQDAAILAIHDSGPGVPDDLAQRIFEPCFTTKPDGSGIGLMSVTAFAASCVADVSVGRSPLGGALFQIRIPMQKRPSNPH